MYLTKPDDLLLGIKLTTKLRFLNFVPLIRGHFCVEGRLTLLIGLLSAFFVVLLQIKLGSKHPNYYD